MGAIENSAQAIQEQLAETWLPRIYRERILKLRTRSYRFDNASAAARVVIQHTLLGVELKIGRKRFLCPDLATARYLSVFARIDVRNEGGTNDTRVVALSRRAFSRMSAATELRIRVAIGLAIGFVAIGIAEFVQPTAPKKPAIALAAREPVRLNNPRL